MVEEAPLTPADCDLRGLPYMPLFGDRLFGSATWIGASAEAKVAALRLWWRSYAHEVPAASLPNDDLLLADYAGYGVAVKAWRKIKEQAMRGWILCSDGRLYHRIVAEIALEAWGGRVRNREKQKKWRERNQSGDGLVTSKVTPSVTVTEPVTKPARNALSEVEVEEVRKNSEAKASAASAPDIATVVFTTGLTWLRKTTGKSDAACRSLLGKWRKDLGDEALISTLGRAQREGVIDPVSWIEKSIGAHKPALSASRYGGFNL